MFSDYCTLSLMKLGSTLAHTSSSASFIDVSLALISAATTVHSRGHAFHALICAHRLAIGAPRSDYNIETSLLSKRSLVHGQLRVDTVLVLLIRSSA